jgi:hypothetical protein
MSAMIGFNNQKTPCNPRPTFGHGKRAMGILKVFGLIPNKKISEMTPREIENYIMIYGKQTFIDKLNVDKTDIIIDLVKKVRDKLRDDSTEDETIEVESTEDEVFKIPTFTPFIKSEYDKIDEYFLYRNYYQFSIDNNNNKISLKISLEEENTNSINESINESINDNIDKETIECNNTYNNTYNDISLNYEINFNENKNIYTIYLLSFSSIIIFILLFIVCLFVLI